MFIAGTVGAWDAAFKDAAPDVEFDNTRDLGDRIVAISRVHTRGRASGAVTESPFQLRDQSPTRQGESGSDLPRPQGGPRSRRAVGVGDVAGEPRLALGPLAPAGVPREVPN